MESIDRLMDAYKQSILAAAQRYIAAGLLVFPIHSINEHGKCTCGVEKCPDAGKHPACQRGVKEASKDPNKVLEWFGATAPLRNIAIACGEVSGITVVDVDIGEGKEGAASWAAACGEHGEPVTRMAKTGSGGMHVWFKYSSALKTAGNVLGKGVDVRNNGGYVLAPPSRHKSGGVYEWLNDAPLAHLPAHLSTRKEKSGRAKQQDMYKGKYTIEQVAGMLQRIPADDRDLWRSVGIILGREFNRDDAAWKIYVEWSAKWGGKGGRNHEEISRECFYQLSLEHSDNPLSLGTIVKAAVEHGWAPKAGEVPIGHFVYYGPGNNYLYRPTTTQWIAAAVDAAVSPVNNDGEIMKASSWLQANQLATSMTSDPALEDDYIKGIDCRNGEIVKTIGAALFNTYRKPTIELGDARLAHPFVNHVQRMLPKDGDAKQFIDYMAHRVQRPWEKPRFALLLAGGQGVGKDTAIEFCCPAIGVWNVANIDPSAFEQNFNEFAAATLVRISEAANLHEMSRWAFAERTKVLIAGSPDVCQINPKYGQKFSIRMFCGVIITTNHLASGIYIPPDDRRYDVMETATLDEMGLQDDVVRREYFAELWDWFLAGGATHVAAYLHAVDLSKFSASGGQRKTLAHRTVIAGGEIGDHWLSDILQELDNPPLVRADWIVTKAVALGEKEFEVRRKLIPSLARLEYGIYRNPAMRDGRWKLNGKLHLVFGKNGCGAKMDVNALCGKELF